MGQKLSGPELVRLKNLVVKHFDDSNWRELGALTNTMEEVETHPRLLRSLSFGDPDYDGLALVFLRKMIGPNDQNLQTVINYISKVSPESGEYVSSEQSSGRRIVFSPNVFQIPDYPVDPILISIMMPFRAELTPVFEIIKSAGISTGFHCTRVDDIWEHLTVIQDVFSLIFQSYIVVCDLTGRNPNVLYEAGIAHTLGKHVVPITQSDDDIPFDLKHHRYAKYLNNNEGRERLKRDLISRFTKLASKRSSLI